MRNDQPTKKELLEGYARREPREFIQIDGWAQGGPDSIFEVDDDGDVVCGMRSQELMRGHAVRVLMQPEVDKRTRIRLLEKALELARNLE